MQFYQQSPKIKQTNRPLWTAIHIELQTLIAGPPVEVGVTMYVLSISSVSEVLMVLKSLQILLLTNATTTHKKKKFKKIHENKLTLNRWSRGFQQWSGFASGFVKNLNQDVLSHGQIPESTSKTTQNSWPIFKIFIFLSVVNVKCILYSENNCIMRYAIFRLYWFYIYI